MVKLSKDKIELHPIATKDFFIMFFDALNYRLDRYYNNSETSDLEQRLMRNLLLYTHIFEARLRQGHNPAALMNEFAPNPQGIYQTKNIPYRNNPPYYQGSKNHTASFIDRLIRRAQFDPSPKARTYLSNAFVDVSKLTPEDHSKYKARETLQAIARESVIDAEQVFHMRIRGSGHSPAELNRLAEPVEVADDSEDDKTKVVYLNRRFPPPQ